MDFGCTSAFSVFSVNGDGVVFRTRSGRRLGTPSSSRTVRAGLLQKVLNQFVNYVIKLVLFGLCSVVFGSSIVRRSGSTSYLRMLWHCSFSKGMSGDCHCSSATAEPTSAFHRGSMFYRPLQNQGITILPCIKFIELYYIRWTSSGGLWRVTLFICFRKSCKFSDLDR